MVEALRSRLGGLTLADEQRLGRRLDGLRKVREPDARARSQAAIERAVEQAEATIERRRGAVPEITYPEHLPVSERRAEIAAAIRGHQVVVLAGETGSGKTTQLPKICLELGRGVRGRIGHTQPRRIAARSVAERLA
jgi:ATP-dependent helicase HrpA